MGKKIGKFSSFNQILPFELAICCKIDIKRYTLVKNNDFSKKCFDFAATCRFLSQPFRLVGGSFLLIHNVVADPVHAILPG